MSIAVITGGSSGIGQASALRLAERGHGVIVTYHSNPAGADETVRLIEAAGGRALALPLDVGRSESFPTFRAAVTDAAAGAFGGDRLGVLVNNAGIGGPTPFEDVTEELFDRFYRVIFKGTYFLTQTLLPLLADGGAIVNVTSKSAGIEGYSAYASMKGALSVLTRTWAKELSPRGIRVNAVSPGPVRTRLADDSFARHPEYIAPLAAQTALGRIGESDDIGRVIAALTSADWAWVTGEVIEVSGGFRM